MKKQKLRDCEQNCGNGKKKEAGFSGGFFGHAQTKEQFSFGKLSFRYQMELTGNPFFLGGEGEGSIR